MVRATIPRVAHPKANNANPWQKHNQGTSLTPLHEFRPWHELTLWHRLGNVRNWGSTRRLAGSTITVPTRMPFLACYGLRGCPLYDKSCMAPRGRGMLL